MSTTPPPPPPPAGPDAASTDGRTPRPTSRPPPTWPGPPPGRPATCSPRPPRSASADVVPAPERVRPDPAADFVLPADAAIRVSRRPGRPRRRRAARRAAPPRHRLPAAGHRPAAPGPATPRAHPAGAAALPRPTGTARPARCRARRRGLPARRHRRRGTDHRRHRRPGSSTACRRCASCCRPRSRARPRSPSAGRCPAGRSSTGPAFAYRGAMLDVARHFFAVADVLRVIDHLARYKLNHLHLHLTDDQGWRIAIDSWPRLATRRRGHRGRRRPRRVLHAGRLPAHRRATPPPGTSPWSRRSTCRGTPTRRWSRTRELAPDEIAPPPYTGTEVGFSYARPGRRADVRLRRRRARRAGRAHPRAVAAHRRRRGVQGARAGVYAGFVERAQRIVAGTGKTVIGWHQLAPAAHARRAGRCSGGAPTATTPRSPRAVRRGARLILSPGNHAYLDMKYAPDTPIGHDWAGLIDVREAYDWDPGTHLAGVPAEAVLGVEAPLWTESVTSLAEIEFMLLPRLPAIAELGWSPRATPRLGRRSGTGWPATARAGPRPGSPSTASPEIPWPTTPTGRPSAAVPRQPTADDAPIGPPTRFAAIRPGTPGPPPTHERSVTACGRTNRRTHSDRFPCGCRPAARCRLGASGGRTVARTRADLDSRHGPGVVVARVSRVGMRPAERDRPAPGGVDPVVGATAGGGMVGRPGRPALYIGIPPRVSPGGRGPDAGLAAGNTRPAGRGYIPRDRPRGRNPGPPRPVE